MTSPVRGAYHVAVDYQTKTPEEMTLREVVEYYKKVVRAGQSLGTPTAMEITYVTQAWDTLLQMVADRHKVPKGWLMYMLTELARNEMTAAELAKQATEESRAALRDS